MPKTDIIIKKRAENVNVNNINVGIHVYCIHNHFMNRTCLSIIQSFIIGFTEIMGHYLSVIKLIINFRKNIQLK